MKNKCKTSNGVVQIKCVYEDKKYTILVNETHMPRMMDELSMVSLRRNPEGELHVFAVFKDKDLITSYKYAGRRDMNFVRFLLQMPKVKSRKRKASMPCIVGDILDLTDERSLRYRGWKSDKDEHVGIVARKRANNVIKYESTIHANGVKKHLGTFDTIQDALKARKKAEKELRRI